MKDFFMWMTLINFGILTLSFVLFISAKDFIYKLHGKWFKMSKENMNKTLYKAMAFYKIAVIVFNLVPYIALVIIG